MTSPDGFADQGQFDHTPSASVGSSAPDKHAPDKQALAQADVLRRALCDGAALDDRGLTALLLGLAIPVDVSALSAGACARFGSFAGLISTPTRELLAHDGFGMHSVAALRLIQAAAIRVARAGVMDRVVLDEWDALIAYLTAALARERIEQFRVLFLDARWRLIADEAQARGTVNHTPVYPREVVKRALELEAEQIILVHNHPSGDPTPSRDDIAMTKQIGQAASLLSIGLADHIIVGNGQWTSFRLEGLLNVRSPGP